MVLTYWVIHEYENRVIGSPMKIVDNRWFLFAKIVMLHVISHGKNVMFHCHVWVLGPHEAHDRQGKHVSNNSSVQIPLGLGDPFFTSCLWSLGSSCLSLKNPPAPSCFLHTSSNGRLPQWRWLMSSPSPRRSSGVFLPLFLPALGQYWSLQSCKLHRSAT